MGRSFGLVEEDNRSAMESCIHVVGPGDPFLNGCRDLVSLLPNTISELTPPRKTVPRTTCRSRSGKGAFKGKVPVDPQR